MDLFSGVDVYFFKLSFLQGFFMIFSFTWLLYTKFLNFFLSNKLMFYLETFLVNLFTSSLEDEKGFSLKGWFSLVFIFFFFITMSKILGLFPYVYGLTTKIYMVFFVSLWGWCTVVFSSMLKFPFLFFGHFCPAGAPLVLGWFLSLVEVISLTMRPGTLTLRLMAKMTTGHMLMGLLTLTSCGLLLKLNLFFSPMMLLMLQGYLMFEFFICMIQGNVFSMLLLNYTSEHL